jgi:hypothetical protein
MSSEADPHLYGQLSITSREAQFGTRKLVNIPWGFRKRLLKISVPAGLKDGAVLRLAGMGKLVDGGQRGDLYLKVLIHP